MDWDLLNKLPTEAELNRVVTYKGMVEVVVDDGPTDGATMGGNGSIMLAETPEQELVEEDGLWLSPRCNLLLASIMRGFSCSSNTGMGVKTVVKSAQGNNKQCDDRSKLWRT